MSSALSEIIILLANTSSTNEKQAILEANKDNEALKELFRATLSPRINFYIRGSQIQVDPMLMFSSEIQPEELTVDTILEVVRRLDKREVTGHAARDYVQGVANRLVQEDAALLIAMLNRDLNCKVAGGLVNRVWKDLIPEYPCLLADKLTPKRVTELLKENHQEYIVQLKADGGRCNAVIRNGAISFFSRNGNELSLLGTFDDALTAFDNCMIDGELVIEKSGETQDRQTGNGIFNKAVRGTISREEADEFVFYVWDIVPIEAYDKALDETPYSVRINNLAELLRKNHNSRVRLIDTKFVKTLEECREYADEQIAKGYEGAIIKIPSLVWENDRSKNMLKIKEKRTGELRCVGWQAHSKKEGMIGSLELESEDGKVQVSSGSGLTDDDRQKDPSEYVGKIIEIEYNMLIKAKGKETYSIFLPVFKTVRLDKDKANTLEELL